ncbi:hypothetical protein KFE25_005755 [Diacronema lutheri]|uniref:Uncharacterized protein n=1 Tax=Diacronema lutheri TaxID=2081491 RepID=A0A8J5XEI1_DIALT|nr:hypothetical protein KFE25_001450 [Diacronema lutheri]KAG8459244.1 hypothetical protein KFE25_005755 [Diacronema lutheri]
MPAGWRAFAVLLGGLLALQLFLLGARMRGMLAPAGARSLAARRARATRGAPALTATGARVTAVAAAASPPPAARGVVLDCAPHGEIRLFLRAEWCNASADSVERVAAASAASAAAGGESSIYRLEPTFLVQGRLGAAGVPTGGARRRARKVMERGEVGWAGGSDGPDFFVYLGDGPAAWLGNPHDGTVWAEVADEASMAVAHAISRLPVPPTRPGQMHIASPPLRVVLRAWRPPAAEPARGAALLKVRGASVDSAAATCAPGCNALPRTELHGAPLVWGANHRTADAAACCAACDAHRAAAAAATPPARGCTVWVFCASDALCGAARGECWLKHAPDPWAADVALGTSPRWTTGTAARAPANHSSGAGAEPPVRARAHVRLVVGDGADGGTPAVVAHLVFRDAGAARARARIERLLRAGCRGACAVLAARAAPAQWGSDALPDGLGEGERWPAGRALVRGTLGPSGAPAAIDSPAAIEWPQAPVVRGSVGWWPTAGGAASADGPAFFVALADMPHLGLSTAVWARVAAEDLPALDALAAAAEAGAIQLPLPLVVERVPGASGR